MEFTSFLPENTQAAIIQPIGSDGVLIAASNTQRGFTRLDQVNRPVHNPQSDTPVPVLLQLQHDTANLSMDIAPFSDYPVNLLLALLTLRHRHLFAGMGFHNCGQAGHITGPVVAVDSSWLRANACLE